MKTVLVIAIMSLAATATAAQTPGVTVQGVAYDSVRGAPLPGAFIAIVGASQSTTTDSAGKFAFSGVAPGVYSFTMQHAAVDSIGLAGITVRITVGDGRDTVRLATPSFATFWRSACGAALSHADSGLVFGSVRSARDRSPAQNVAVSASWLDVKASKEDGVKQVRFTRDVRTNADGLYAVCGVPEAQPVGIQAVGDSLASGYIGIAASDGRIHRRDLLVAASRGVDSGQTGVILGSVIGESGAAVDGALVQTDDVAEVRTGSDGRFVLRGVPLGTRQVDARSIGTTPASITTDVVADDTARVEIRLRKLTTLDTMRVVAPSVSQHLARAYEFRRDLGIGRFFDSTSIAKYSSLPVLFREIPSVRVVREKITFALGCIPTAWLDGTRIEPEELYLLRPEDIAAVEVYPRQNEVPVEFMGSVKKRVCATIVVWTKRRFP